MIRLVAASLAWMEALAEGDEVFVAWFDTPVVPGWAPFPEVIEWMLQDARNGEPDQWGAFLIFDDDGSLVGNGGWKGPPLNGRAELGYAVAPDRRQRGIATLAVRHLLDRAHAAEVRVVVAHTTAETSASTTVLRRCGFIRVGDVVDPEEGPAWRWELALSTEARS